MSRFYGNIIADRGESSRCSQRSITTAARSWNGSVIVTLDEDSSGETRVRIELADGSAAHGRRFVDCSFDQLKKTLNRCKTLR